MELTERPRPQPRSGATYVGSPPGNTQRQEVDAGYERASHDLHSPTLTTLSLSTTPSTTLSELTF